MSLVGLALGAHLCTPPPIAQPIWGVTWEGFRECRACPASLGQEEGSYRPQSSAPCWAVPLPPIPALCESGKWRGGSSAAP